MRVNHDANDFLTGTELILTLVDSNIINKDDLNRTSGLSSSEDTLENITIRDDEQRAHAEKNKKRAFQSLYNSYDDEEFVEAPEIDQKSSLLKQYEDEKWTGQFHEKPTFRIGRVNNTPMRRSAGNEKSMLTDAGSKLPTFDATSRRNDYSTADDYSNRSSRIKREKSKRRNTRIKMVYDNNDDHETNSINAVLEYDHAKDIRESTFKSELLTLDTGDDADLAQSLVRARRIAQMRHGSQPTEHGAEVASSIAVNEDRQKVRCAQVGLDVLHRDMGDVVDAEGRR